MRLILVVDIDSHIDMKSPGLEIWKKPVDHNT